MRSGDVKRKPDRVTMKDIAQELGVTVTTVSRALNDKPDISPETKGLVLQTARRMGYVQSALGRDLASGYMKAIGCVVTTIADPYLERVLEGIENSAQEAGYAVIIATSQADPDREATIIDMLLGYRVAGIVSTSSWITQSHLSKLTDLNVPIVLVNSEEPSPQTTSIRIDDSQVAKLATEHLIKLGHRRIAHITVPDRSVSSRARLAGYERSLEGHGIAYDPALVIETDESEHGGAEALQRLLQVEPRPEPQPSAVFCYNDQMAIGALAASHRVGLRVPEDISVVGVDDIAVSAWLEPSLTTVRQPLRRMGHMAMEMMLNLLDDRSKVKDVMIPGELVVRESTAPPMPLG